MTGKYLFDTNILIYYLNNDIPPAHIQNIENIINTSFIISEITRLELLGWTKLNQDGIKVMEEFITKSKMKPVSKKVIDTAIQVRQNHKIKTSDSIIAATALNNEYILITRNHKDFYKISELNIYNPFE